LLLGMQNMTFNKLPKKNKVIEWQAKLYIHG